MPLSDTELAIAAAQAGAAVVRDRYGRAEVVVEKGERDVATDADLESERVIRAAIQDARPADGFSGEESGSESGTSGRTWLVDPICGTANYAVRTSLVSVNVALRDTDGVLSAAVADPFGGQVFWSGAGRGAWVRDEWDVDTRAMPLAACRLVDLNLDNPRSRDTVHPTDLLADRAFAAAFGARVVSSTLALAWVAVGRRAAYVTDGDLQDSVHFTAGIALCQEAGCVVTGLAGQPLHTGVGGLVAAADEATHAELVEILTRLRT